MNDTTNILRKTNIIKRNTDYSELVYYQSCKSKSVEKCTDFKN